MKGTIVKTHYKEYGVGIYLPPSYQEKREYSCVVIQDGDVFIKERFYKALIWMTKW